MAGKSIDDLQAEIDALEKHLAEEPQRILDEQNRKLTYIPASDELIAQRNENHHRHQVTRGEVVNTRITQGKDAILILFFILAISAIGLWVYNSIEGI